MGHETNEKDKKTRTKTVESFEDLEVWQRAHKLVIRIYEITSTFPKSEMYNLTQQLRSSACSVKANIAEGFGRYHYNDSKNFYRNARGSLSETKDHLLTARDVPDHYITREIYSEVAGEIEVIRRQLNGLIGATGAAYD